MGRYAGWIALYAGVASVADVIGRTSRFRGLLHVTSGARTCSPQQPRIERAQPAGSNTLDRASRCGLKIRGPSCTDGRPAATEGNPPDGNLARTARALGIALGD